jgi:hypothetical protein
LTSHAALALHHTQFFRGQRGPASREGERPVQEEIAAYLAGKIGRDYCDECLAAVLHVARPLVTNAARELASTSPSFLSDTWTCTVCGKRAVVTRALSGARVTSRGPGREDPAGGGQHIAS